MHINETEIRFQLALEAAELSLWDSTIVNGQVIDGPVHWTASGPPLLGLPATPITQPYRHFLEHVHPDDRESIVTTMQAAVTGSGRYAVEYRVVWPDGSLHWLAARARILYESAEGVRMASRTLGIVWDITDRKQAEFALITQREMADLTLGSIGDGVLTTDVQGNVQSINRVGQQLTGWSNEDARGLPIDRVFRIIDELNDEPFENPVLKCLRLNQTVAMANRSALISRNGNRVAIEDTAAPIRDASGRTLGAVIVFHDVSHERQLRHELSWQASHDALTGLINRREFEFQVAAALASAKADCNTHALLYLDLDQFKIVNDTCGHGAGDVLLQHLATLLQSHMRDSDVLARLGGDELGVLLLNCPLRQALALAEKLREAIKDYRFVWDRNTFEVGVSIGLVSIDEDSKSTSDLLSAADQACYGAKEQGRNRVHHYLESEQVMAKRHGEILWVSRLNEAFETNRFILFVQPIRSLIDSTARHAEVLLRLKGNDGLMVLPGAFIPAAERYGLMLSIDRWVIESVCRHLAPQAQDGDADGSILAINLSGVSLNDDGLHDFVIGCFDRHGTPPKRICFEITETAAVANLNKARDFMMRLQKLGVRFSLDDFGSGLSSFAYLKSLSVDFLKIDGLFVRDIATNEINRAMVSAINEVGHVMGIKTIAECVESPEVLATVQQIGIDFAQGFVISPLQLLADYSGQ